jgi:hypothetical protein
MPLLARLAALVGVKTIEPGQLTADDAIFATMIVEQTSTKPLRSTSVTKTGRETTDES